MDSFRAVAADYGICIDGDVVKISRKWTESMFKLGFSLNRKKILQRSANPNENSKESQRSSDVCRRR